MNIDRLVTTIGAVLLQQEAYLDEQRTALDLATREASYTRMVLRAAEIHRTHKTQQSRENLRSALEKGGERWAEAARDLE